MNNLIGGLAGGGGAGGGGHRVGAAPPPVNAQPNPPAPPQEPHPVGEQEGEGDHAEGENPADNDGIVEGGNNGGNAAQGNFPLLL
jgi:hypothetical protein